MQAILRAICGYNLDSSHPLALFYHCDLAVVHQMTQLSQEMKGTSNNLDRRSKLIKDLKDSQHNLILVLMHMINTIIPELKQSRDFRCKYPDELTIDQTYGPVWFAAECLAAGSRIASHEYESIELKPYAVRLSNCITRIRQALREEEANTNFKPTGKIQNLLRDFDKSWVDFEFRYVSAMCSVHTEMQLVHQQEIAVLFSEATHRALNLKYFSHDQLEMMEPSVMFAIPRLAIMSGLIVFPDGPINPQRPSVRIPACFRPYKQLLTKIKDLLSTLNEEELSKLEEALCSSRGASSFEKSPLPSPVSHLTGSDALSPSAPFTLTSHQRDDQFPDRSLIFEPDPTTTVITDTITETNLETQNETQNENENSIKENEHHEVPSTSAPIPGSSSFDILSRKIIIDSPVQQTLQLLTSNFTSSKDLLHKLFLAISEVADQLQTNFPRDYRSILKQVFLMYSGDDENGTHQMEKTAGESDSLFAAIGFDLSLSRLLFTSAHKAKSSEVEWVLDSQSQACHVCEERFSLFRRRHHCRSCGQVVCGRCSPHNLPLHQASPKPERVCSSCYIEELGRMAKTLTTATVH